MVETTELKLCSSLKVSGVQYFSEVDGVEETESFVRGDVGLITSDLVGGERRCEGMSSKAGVK